jgi:hypothetical protein
MHCQRDGAGVPVSAFVRRKDCGIRTSVSYWYLKAAIGSTFVARRAGM